MSSDYYPFIQVADDEPEIPEQLGTKQKYWLYRDDDRYLLKLGRPNTGENWAEIVACELCELLGLPHAHYEFSVWKGQKGVICKTVVPVGGRLVLGNELLSEIHSNYPSQENYGNTDHTLGRIHGLLSQPEITTPIGWRVPDACIKTAFDVFVGYLMLDAWIANQDRHHENWAVISTDDGIYLSPTFDHAASMGQNETDKKRKTRLTSSDPRQRINAYIEKARSAIYLNKSEPKPLSTVDAFRQAASRSPKAAKYWQSKLADVSNGQCLEVFERIPKSEISDMAIEFAMTLLVLNKLRILENLSK
ncbi:phosphatidylinositol kinase [Methylomonas koyamae]|uniref:phosphatidylinositol kinase n=1 Tax=Methylomonas koyamae TaxID=702114 RepID=UPI000BC2D955|nr:phosphatidylinositol kinase [Methylomonas koyamae]ATG91412.1 HipA domain-containing protein [Methylomonas koyamae]